MAELQLIECNDDGGECAEHAKHFAFTDLKYGEELHMKDVSETVERLLEVYSD